MQHDLLTSALDRYNIRSLTSWYYTPMAMEFAGDLEALLTVYDCMDELSAFAGAPPSMRRNEDALFRKADLVFTGGARLYHAKKQQHAAVHLFPSSIDAGHFSSARISRVEPEDQKHIPQPRLGYAGVIDERMDIELLRQAAEARPNWHFVMVGPVAKIDPATLPTAPNIHYLGLKDYDELPGYFSGWSIGMLPFAMNESTKFISPTKTPEYLAAGLRIVSTSIQDVITPYGELGLAAIVKDAQEFVGSVEALLAEGATGDFLDAADALLAKSSWDETWTAMNTLMDQRLAVSSIDSSPENSFAASEKD